MCSIPLKRGALSQKWNLLSGDSLRFQHLFEGVRLFAWCIGFPCLLDEASRAARTLFSTAAWGRLLRDIVSAVVAGQFEFHYIKRQHSYCFL